MKLIVSVVGLYPPPADCYVQPKKNMFALLLVSIIDFTVNDIQLIVSIVDPCPPPADCYVAQPKCKHEGKKGMSSLGGRPTVDLSPDGHTACISSGPLPGMPWWPAD